ncbi:hypothetical protein [Pseudoduganella violaceinigra]|uniref:hypothetical protein n=1 Tax=Pseudoduganella violaceinigra TaxID=246602 RepID=UPI0004824877|nr:hypothetical protein [Pseudoduganella violaceinigra]
MGNCVTGILQSGTVSKKEWIQVKVQTGHCAGMSGAVRRKWLIQHYATAPKLAALDRKKAADIIRRYSVEFDGVHYALGTKAKSWAELKARGSVDCSG